MHTGLSNPPGRKGGVESITLKVAEIPSHRHPVRCKNSAGTKGNPGGNYPAGSMVSGRGTINKTYATSADATATMNSAALSSAGDGGVHNNMQPFLALNFCIALTGLFPSRN